MDKETQSELDRLRAANEALTERAQQAEQQLALKIFHDIGQAVPEHAYLVQQAYVMEKRAAAAEARCTRLAALLGEYRELLSGAMGFMYTHGFMAWCERANAVALAENGATHG
jgi:hypothetical protein